ncbi:MAG: radical SAM protein [Clostridia bacterium]|nr:radical SAM protein [Clostridia bacterium]
MPNIMLTYRCNLNCPYCFANEFVNKSVLDMSEENFDKAVGFITRKGPTNLGLIGGEPTLHPDFNKFLVKLMYNPNINDVLIYTNGLRLDSLKEQLLSLNYSFMAKFLVNCNSPKVMGQANYEKLVRNLDALITENFLKDNFKLGINLYSNDLDYTYIIDLLKRYDYNTVRFSLTVPDFSAGEEWNALEYFKSRKGYLIRFLHDMEENGILAYYDCNKPPACIWSKEEMQWLTEYVHKYPRQESNLLGMQASCNPVIDILPNLRAVRCFGMSDFSSVAIKDYRSVADIAAYFKNTIDAEACRISADAQCRKCYERQTMHCTGGCIGFKQEAIKNVNAYVSQIDVKELANGQ